MIVRLDHLAWVRVRICHLERQHQLKSKQQNAMDDKDYCFINVYDFLALE